MDTTALKYFIAVAELQHMTNAAKTLNVTEPSLSASIRRLENEIGYSLFDRTGRNIQLNEYGKIFLQACTEIVDKLDAACSQMDALRAAQVKFVCLACSGSASNSRVIDMLTAKGVNLHVQFIPVDWEASLLNKVCDIVITAGRLRKSQTRIDFSVLLNQRIVFVCNAGHPLAHKKSVSPRELSSYPFCSTGTPHALINVAAENLNSFGIHPHVTFLGRNASDMRKQIAGGQYLGLMAEHNVTPDSGLIALPVEMPPLYLPLFLYWRKSDSNSQLISSICRDILAFYQDKINF